MRSLHSLEHCDDYERLRREAAERRQYLEALNRCSLAERYVKYDLSVILDLCIKRDDLLERIEPMRESDIELVSSPVWVLEFHALDTADREHWDQEMVFVVNIELVNGQNIGVPSVVGFYSIYDKDDKGERYYGFEGRPKLISGLVRIDRKLAVFGLAHNTAPCNIQSAMQIMNYITHDQRDIGSQCAVSKSVVEELFPRISVHVQAGAVTIGRGSESLLDIRDVLVGPLNF